MSPHDTIEIINLLTEIRDLLKSQNDVTGVTEIVKEKNNA